MRGAAPATATVARSIQVPSRARARDRRRAAVGREQREPQRLDRQWLSGSEADMNVDPAGVACPV